MKTYSAILFEQGLERPYAESKPLKILETELNPIDSDEVIIEFKAAGLCHSDLGVISGKRLRGLPIALGHEASGIIKKVGKAVEGFEIGDHVVCSFVPSCGKCDFCIQGIPSQCSKGNEAGNKGTLLSGRKKIKYKNRYLHHHSGISAFSKHAIVSESSIVKVSKDVPFEVAAIFGCAVVTGVGAVLNTAQVFPGSTVGIIGLGGVGLSALLGAKLAGAKEIVAFDINEDKLKFAKRLGATETINVRKKDYIETLKNKLDFGIETAGATDTLKYIYNLTKPRGVIVTTSLPHPQNNINTSHFDLTFTEKTIKGSYIGSSVFKRDIPRYIDFYEKGLLPVDKLITETIDYQDINEGFDKLANGEVNRIVIKY